MGHDKVTFPCHFFIRSDYFGTGQRDFDMIHGKFQLPRSLAFFCPVCGEVWARAHVEGSYYQIYSQKCDKHETDFPFSPPGSIWLDWDARYRESLPPKILAREALLHCNLALKLHLTELREDWFHETAIEGPGL